MSVKLSEAIRSSQRGEFAELCAEESLGHHRHGEHEAQNTARPILRREVERSREMRRDQEEPARSPCSIKGNHLDVGASAREGGAHEIA